MKLLQAGVEKDDRALSLTPAGISSKEGGRLMELTEVWGPRGGRGEASLPFGVQRSFAHHDGVTTEMPDGWPGRGLRELPKCPATQDIGQHLT